MVARILTAQTVSSTQNCLGKKVLFNLCIVLTLAIEKLMPYGERRRLNSMDLSTILTLFLAALVKVKLATGEEEELGGHQKLKPALIGFRCENSHQVTDEGISVIEANRQVQLTLFGEHFTPETIVAFTTEFVPKIDEIDKVLLANNGDIESAQNLSHPLLAGTKRRRKSLAWSYDCTDFNRVTSYRLTKENILSPNVAIVTINLPELDESVSGKYYYFCVKQPNSASNRTIKQADQNDPIKALVWVHQGDDWWLTIRVEPPILSVANDCILILLLLFLSAVTSGLNLGLMSLDMNELAVISSCGDQRERSYARAIVPVRKRGNYLLCSLLLGNVMVNSTLTVILEEMTSGLVAVIGSTLAIVILGEIVPQAFCARQGLAIGAKTIWLTYAFMLLTFPLSYPIACLLDCVLGEEKGNVYDRERLMEFIKITGHHTQLEADEVAIISGALKLKKIKVDQIMTRIEDVFMLPLECMLDRETIKRIIEKGYSRIPVYELGDRKQIVALILAKDLALLDPDDQMPLANMLKYCKHPLIFIDDTATLDLALNEFKTGKSHMAVVRQIYDDGEVDKYYEAIGIVTLEDVIEEVLQTEINDETDTLSDNRRKRRRTNAQVAHFLDIEPAQGAMSGEFIGFHQQQPVASGQLLASNINLSQAAQGVSLNCNRNGSSRKPAPIALTEATYQELVLSTLIAFVGQVRSLIGQLKVSLNRLFVSCLGVTGQQNTVSSSGSG